MSFDIFCGGCGAPSSPAVGRCPYCKSIFTNKANPTKGASQSLTRVEREYSAGRLDMALQMLVEMEKAKPELRSDRAFSLLYVKTLFEIEGSKTKIRSLLAPLHLANPQDSEVNDLLDLVDARGLLEIGPLEGERALRTLLRRSPDNHLVLFLLATHLFWEHDETNEALIHLESCLRLRPSFLRAWACVGTIYKKLGNEALMNRAFSECLKLETNESARDFFKSQLTTIEAQPDQRRSRAS